ncbi:hypothetical protein EDB80DRAFT_590559 [Ilyonectria destructans]|nr:hypothetical protein EDB80DRAFT_590559 [Ilyonectria destructans]
MVCPPFSQDSFLTAFQSFEKNDLTKERDFFADAKPPPTTAEGKGQMVYWVDCCVKIYKTSDPRKSIRDMDP